MASTAAHYSRYQSSTSVNSSAKTNPQPASASASASTPLINKPSEFEDVIVGPDELWIQQMRQEQSNLYEDQAKSLHKQFLVELDVRGPNITGEEHQEIFQVYQMRLKTMKKEQEVELERIIDIERTARLWSLGKEVHDKTKWQNLQAEQQYIYQNIRAEAIRSGPMSERTREELMREQVEEVADEAFETSTTTLNWEKTEPQRKQDRQKWRENARANENVRIRRQQDEASFVAQERMWDERATQIAEEARIGKDTLRAAAAGARNSQNSNLNSDTTRERRPYSNNTTLREESSPSSTSTSGRTNTSGGSTSSTNPTSVSDSGAAPLFWNPNEPSPVLSSTSTSTARPVPVSKPTATTTHAQGSAGNASTPTNAKSGRGEQPTPIRERWIPPGAAPPSRKPSMNFESAGSSAGPARKPSMQFNSAGPGVGPARKPSMQFSTAGKASLLFGASPAPVHTSIPEEMPQMQGTTSTSFASSAAPSAPSLGAQPLPTVPPVNFPPRQTPPTSFPLPRQNPSTSLPPRQSPPSSRQNTFPSFPASSSTASTATRAEPPKPPQPTRSFSASYATADDNTQTPKPQHPSVSANGNGNVPRSFSANYSTTSGAGTASGNAPYSSTSGAGAYSSASGAGAGTTPYSSASAAAPPFSSASGNGSGPYTATNKAKYGAQAPFGAGASGVKSSTSSASAAQAQAGRDSFSTVNDEARAQMRTQYQSEQQRLAEEEQKRRENEINEKRAEEARRRGEERRRQEELARDAQRREAERKARAARAASGQPPLPPKNDEAVIDVWNAYEQQWSAMANATSLRFRSIPWPMMSRVDDPEQLVPVQIAHFILNPLHSTSKSRKDRLKEALLRWHPDRFETKWLKKVVEEEKEAVKDGVGRVVRALNELLNPSDLFG